MAGFLGRLIAQSMKRGKPKPPKRSNSLKIKSTGGIVEVNSLEELYKIAENKGEPLKHLAFAFTDHQGTTYIPKQKVLQKHGQKQSKVLAHERNIMKARKIVNEDPEFVDSIMQAVEMGDADSVKPETIKYYNHISKLDHINRAELEIEVMAQELAQQEISSKQKYK